MSHAAYPLQRIIDRLRVPVTVLAKNARVDGSILSKILNARGGLKLSGNYLERLCALDELTDEERSGLVMGFLEDQLPADLRPLVLILRGPGGASGEAVLRESAPEEADTLTQALQRLGTRARSSPALARALKDLAGVLEGRDETV